MKKYINNWPSTKKCFEDKRLLMGQVKYFSDSFKQKGRKLESPYINFNEFSKSPEAKKNTNFYYIFVFLIFHLIL